MGGKRRVHFFPLNHLVQHVSEVCRNLWQGWDPGACTHEPGQWGRGGAGN